MRPTRLSLAFLLLSLPAIHGCSSPPATAASDAVADAPSLTTETVAAAAPEQTLKACDLVTPKEMSAILGSDVDAEPNEGSSGKTECIYKPAEAVSPYVEFSVEWGEGETAMTAMGTMGQIEPGSTSPYDGIGDQAATVGTALWVRSGEDLVRITFSGVDDAPAKARKIFDTAKARM